MPTGDYRDLYGHRLRAIALVRCPCLQVRHESMTGGIVPRPVKLLTRQSDDMPHGRNKAKEEHEADTMRFTTAAKSVEALGNTVRDHTMKGAPDSRHLAAATCHHQSQS